MSRNKRPPASHHPDEAETRQVREEPGKKGAPATPPPAPDKKVESQPMDPSHPPLWLHVAGQANAPVAKVLPRDPYRPLANPISANDLEFLIEKSGKDMLARSEGMDLGAAPYSDKQVRDILQRAQRADFPDNSPEMKNLRYNPAVSALVRAHAPDGYVWGSHEQGDKSSKAKGPLYLAKMPLYLHKLIEEKAAKYGVDPYHMKIIASIESGSTGFSPTAANPISSARGIWQIVEKYSGDYGLTPDERFDPVKSTEGAAKKVRDNRNYFRSKFGRDPRVGESYMMWQQGAGGTYALLRNPGALASSVVGLQEVLDNGGSATDNCAQFAGHWIREAGDTPIAPSVVSGPRPSAKSVYGIDFVTNEDTTHPARLNPGDLKTFHTASAPDIKLGQNLVFAPVKPLERGTYEARLKEAATRQPAELTQEALAGLKALGYLPAGDQSRSLADKSAHQAMNRFRHDTGLPEQKKPSPTPAITEAVALATYSSRIDYYAERQARQKGTLMEGTPLLDLQALMPRPGESSEDKAARDAAAPQIKLLKYALMEAGTLSPTMKGKTPQPPTGEVDAALVKAVADYQKMTGLEPTCEIGTEKVVSGKTRSGKPTYAQAPVVKAGSVDSVTAQELFANLAGVVGIRKSNLVAGVAMDDATYAMLDISSSPASNPAPSPRSVVAAAEPNAPAPADAPAPPAPAVVVSPSPPGATPQPIWTGDARYAHGRHEDVKRAQELGDVLGYGEHLGAKGADGYWAGRTNDMFAAAAKALNVDWKRGQDPGPVVLAMQQEMARRAEPILQQDRPPGSLAHSFAEVVEKGGIQYNPREKKPEVEAVQTMLSVTGYPIVPETPDGRYGKGLEEGLSQFAKDEKIRRKPREASPELLTTLQKKAEERLGYFGLSPTKTFSTIAPPGPLPKDQGVSLEALRAAGQTGPSGDSNAPPPRRTPDRPEPG